MKNTKSNLQILYDKEKMVQKQIREPKNVHETAVKAQLKVTYAGSSKV